MRIKIEANHDLESRCFALSNAPSEETLQDKVEAGDEENSEAVEVRSAEERSSEAEKCLQKKDIQTLRIEDR